MDDGVLLIIIGLPLVVVGIALWYAFRRAASREASSHVPDRSIGTYLHPLPTARLTFTEGPQTGRDVEIRGRQVSIGRSPESDIHLDDLLVSWEHAILSFEPENRRYVIYDRESSNGTWVNNQRIAQHAIRVGVDQIRIGPSVFVLRLQGLSPIIPTPLPMADAISRQGDLSIGEFEDYERLELLGRGGASVVFKARSRSDGRLVAVKVLTQVDPYNLGKFKQERGYIARVLQHPHIVRVYGGGEEWQSGRPYLVMELMQGGTLRSRLSPGVPLPYDHVVAIAGQICDALQYAHRKGVYHRDLKPENVFFDQRGVVKLGDFGIARLAQAVTQTSSGFLIGTPQYMSYEQARGLRDIDGRSDLYALGAILYELVVGRPPFTADNPLAVVDRHLRDSPVPPSHLVPGVPLHIESVILRSLEKDRSRRFQEAGDMARALGYTGLMHDGQLSSAAHTADPHMTQESRGPLCLVRSDGSSMRLTEGMICLGRAEVDPADIGISRRHAAVVFRDGLPWLEDCRSANGTFVNGQRIFSPHMLREGDVIRMGRVTLRVRAG